MKKILSVTLAVMLVLLAAGPVHAGDCASQYTVKQGDWLKTIAAQFDVAWRDIAAANSIANANIIYIGQVLCIPGEGETTSSSGNSSSTASSTGNTASTTATTRPIATFTIVSVLPGQSVTIQTANFPENLNFNVLLGPLGTRGENGTLADTISSGAGGSFTATVSIAAGMQSAAHIAIRTESTTTAHYSYNWFFNNGTVR